MTLGLMVTFGGYHQKSQSTVYILRGAWLCAVMVDMHTLVHLLSTGYEQICNKALYMFVRHVDMNFVIT